MKQEPSVYDFTLPELGAMLEGWDLNRIHAARLWNYLYLGLVESFDAMPELPARVRRKFAASLRFHSQVAARESNSSDGFTRKYLIGLEDGSTIETVRMRFTGRVTACISTQVGCAMGCVFCATGQMGFSRNLTTGEIVGQAVRVARLVRAEGSRLRNVVLMGMGEPLHNYDAVMKALDIVHDSAGLGLGADRITLSTVGVVPGILRLAREKRPFHLAVSLHAATQPERAALVPVAKKWPLDELMAACRTYSKETGRRIFYEWTLIEGRNDSPADAMAVGHLLRGLPAQVNLIPLNPTSGYSGTPGRSDSARRFQEILRRDFSLPSTVRQRRGIDIAAGCGQLAAPRGGPADAFSTRCEPQA